MQFSIGLNSVRLTPQTFKRPAVLKMGSPAASDAVTKIIWRSIFSHLPFQKRHELRLVNKSWYHVINEIETALKNSEFEWSTHYPKIDFGDRITHFAESARCFALNSALFVLRIKKEWPRDTFNAYEIAVFTDKVQRFPLQNLPESIHKISNTKFAIVARNQLQAIKVIYFYSVMGDEKPVSTLKAEVIPTGNPAFFKDEFAVTTCYKMTSDYIFVINIFSLVGTLTQNMKMNLNTFRYQVQGLSKNYLVLSSTEDLKYEIRIVDRKNRTSLGPLPYEFINNKDNIILFQDRKENAILSLDFENLKKEPLFLFNMDECIASYMTESAFYFIDRKNYLYIYSTKLNCVAKQRLQDDVFTITKCEFMRVTKNNLILKVELEKDGDLHERVKVYTLDSNKITLNEEFPKSDDIFFDRSGFISVNHIVENRVGYRDPRELKFYTHSNHVASPNLKMHLTHAIEFLPSPQHQAAESSSK